MKPPLGLDTIWLGNIPFVLTLAMLSHALQIMGAMYYLCFKTSKGMEGVCYKASVKSLNMSQLGLRRSNQMKHLMAEGRNKMLDWLAIPMSIRISRCLPLRCAIHWVTTNIQLGICSVRYFKETVHSSKAKAKWDFNRLLWENLENLSLIINHCFNNLNFLLWLAEVKCRIPSDDAHEYLIFKLAFMHKVKNATLIRILIWFTRGLAKWVHLTFNTLGRVATLGGHASLNITLPKILPVVTGPGAPLSTDHQQPIAD